MCKLSEVPARFLDFAKASPVFANHQMVHVVHACPVPRLIAGGEMK